MKVVRRTKPAREPQTAVTHVVEEGVNPPPGPPLEPAPDRELWPWLLLLLVLVIGGIVAAVVLTRDDNKKSSTPATTVAPATTVTVSRVTTPTPAGTTKTPSAVRVKLAGLVGIPASAAVKRLRDSGLQPVVRSVFSAKQRGLVAAQEPGPGTRLAKGASVILSVSKGQAAKPVPDAVGQSESQAVALLRAAGFGATTVDVPSGETKGNVVAQRPAAGGKAQPGTKVRLNVSAGSVTTAPATTAPATTALTTPAQPAQPAQPATTTVPDVQGTSLQQARLSLRKARIVMAIRYVPSDQPVGTVVAQAKQPGTTAKRNAHMLVTVSQGGSGGTTAATLATVPDVVGMDEQAARTRLQQAGFSPVAEDFPTGDSSQDGKVVDEQPAPATEAPKGSQIIIYVGRVQSAG